MTGFRLTPDVAGCPPTLTPPTTYENPFRVDAAGALWIRKCFKGLRYFGAARHDINEWVVLGGKTTQVGRGAEWTKASGGISAGTYRNITLTNQTECPMAFLLGHDTFVNLYTRGDNQVVWVIESKWNGEHHDWSRCSNNRWYNDTTLSDKMTQDTFNTSACPHDNGFETTGQLSLTLAPGESATVSAKMHAFYQEGAPSGSEYILAAYSAVRVWGYIVDEI
jgi:hypothetical protein